MDRRAENPVSVRGGPPQQLTHGSKRNDKPAFAPDGKTIAFVSDRGGKPQVWRVPLDGGEASKLTDLPGNVVDLSWLPDGKQGLSPVCLVNGCGTGAGGSQEAVTSPATRFGPRGEAER